MAEVGTYYITIMPNMNSFTGAVKEAFGDVGKQAGKATSNSFWDVLRGSAIGTALGNFASMVGSEIMAGLNVGISRIDTIQNFPKVMQALGYESKEASRSVQLIMDHLDGLPTATQDVVALTQAIADSTGDLDLATRAALGFNDMMLANGSTAAEITQAQGVFNRVLGKGNATVAQWQSLQSVMPAQLALVARELMGESGTVEALRDNLNDGTISWNDFLRAIVRLDEEGTGSIASFYDQAVANSHGIGTALANVQNRIGAGWAKILEGLGRESISKTIDNISYGIRDAMYRVGEAVKWLKYTILGSDIGDSLVRIFDNIKGAFQGLKNIDLKEFARGVIDVVDGALKWVADNGETVAGALSMIGGALSVVLGMGIGAKIMAAVEAVQGFIAAGGVFSAMSAAVLPLLAALAAGVVYFFTCTEQGRAIMDKFSGWFRDFYLKAKDTFRKVEPELRKFVDSAVRKFNDMVSKGKAIWNTLKTVISTVVGAIVKLVTGKWDEIRTSHDKAINAVKVTFTTIMTNIRTAASTAWNTIKSTFETALNAIHTTVTNVLNILKTIWDNTLGKILGTTQTTFNGVKTTFSTVTSGITTIWNGLSSALPKTFQGIADKASSTFNSMRDKVTNAFSSMKNNANSQMDSLNSSAASKASKIASHFNSQYPKIKVGVSYPYLASVYSSISSKAALLSGGKVANLYWAAKGGVFDVPTVIGIGEKGREAALPLNDATYQEMARGIVGQMEDKGQASVLITGNTFNVRNDDDIERIADAIAVRIQRQGRGSL